MAVALCQVMKKRLEIDGLSIEEIQEMMEIVGEREINSVGAALGLTPWELW